MKNTFRNTFNLAIILKMILLSFYITNAYALPDDIKQKLHITANTSQFNYKTGFNTYDGSVTVSQGSTRVFAERVTTQSNDKHKIEEACAYGNDQQLAKFTTTPKAGDKEVQAQAKIIKFYPDKGIVLLEGDVDIIQAENSFKGQRIIYNIHDEIVSAPATTNGRTTIIFTPAKNELSKNNDKNSTITKNTVLSKVGTIKLAKN